MCLSNDGFVCLSMKNGMLSLYHWHYFFMMATFYPSMSQSNDADVSNVNCLCE